MTKIEYLNTIRMKKDFTFNDPGGVSTYKKGMVLTARKSKTPGDFVIDPQTGTWNIVMGHGISTRVPNDHLEFVVQKRETKTTEWENV